MKYSTQELFAFMDSGRRVVVVCDDGQEFQGKCWAYGEAQNEEEFGIDEPSIELESGVMLYASEIKSIKFAD